MKAIAILLPSLRPGGAEQVMLKLAQSFIGRGYAVDLVLVRAEGALLRKVPAQVRIVDLGCRGRRNAVIPLVRYLRARRPSALLIAMWPLTVLGALAARLAGTGTTVVVSEHNTLSLAARPDRRGRRIVLRVLLKASLWWLGRTADGVVAVSEGVAKDLALLSRAHLSSISVIHNPAARGDGPARGPSDQVVEEWWSDGVKRIVTAGTLKAQKDQRTLIAAFAELSQRVAAKLLILGEGPLRSELERFSRELGVGGDVLLRGHVEDPPAYFAQADLFVISSRFEGFANVIVEAMECGLPVVSTDCASGPAEILTGGRYGRLVPVGDRRALSSAMLAALQEPVDVAAQQRRAREFGLEPAAEAYLRLLDPPSAEHNQLK